MARRRRTGGLGETVKAVVMAVGIALLIRTAAAEPFTIPSESMVPTLLVGDYIFATKPAYGYSRHSLPLGLPLWEGRVLEQAPQRGDVVIFKLPTDPDGDPYVKRVIGLPGDRVQVVQGLLHVNGEPAERQRIEDFVAADGRIRLPQYIETLPGGASHRIIEMQGDYGLADNTPIYVVPPNHYFMMGDNRDNSQDSRFLNEVGYVPAENLIGRADFLFFSSDGTAATWEVWKWPTTLRAGRWLMEIG